MKFSPTAGLNAPLKVRVTCRPSNYEISSGLRINGDEPLVNFYNSFAEIVWARSDESIAVELAEQARTSLKITDQRTGQKIYIGCHKTLRLPEDGRLYAPPSMLGTFPILSVSGFSGTLPPSMQRKGGFFLPMF
jgi:hypothetical protein